jgi:hypothetical protein
MIVRRPAPVPRPVVVSGRHPYEIFMMVMALATGLPTVLGVTPTPGSLNSLVDPLAAHIWGISLTVGAATALLGVVWPQPADTKLMSVTALGLEQIGLVTVGCAGVFYAATLALTPTASMIGIGIVAAFGAASLWRAWQLQRLLKGAPRFHREKRRGQ